MARGFESKSVQDQQDEESKRRQDRVKKRLDPGEIEQNKRREELMLSRTRVARELAETVSDRRKESLTAALAHLDREITKL